MKRIFNMNGSNYDGEMMTKTEGAEALEAIGHERGWSGKILALQLDAWIARF
jgi:hypothetical protein